MSLEEMKSESEKAQLAASRFAQTLGARASQRDKLINALANMQIKDYLVPPSRLRFDNVERTLQINFNAGADRTLTHTLHRHALSQMSAKVQLGAKTVSMLLDADQDQSWKTALLAHNLTELFQKTNFSRNDDKFMLRAVQGEVRGFVSKKFNRRRASSMLFHHFVDEMTVQKAYPFHAEVHPTHLSFQMFLPYPYEPVQDDPLFVGLEWSNSDFGVGKHTIRFLLYRAKDYSIIPCRDVLSQIHIGSVLDSTEIELSPETEEKDAAAQASALRDTIRAHITEPQLDKLFDAIRDAHERKIGWSVLKQKLSEVMRKGELEQLDARVVAWAEELPPITWGPSSVPESTAWFAAVLTARLANAESDEDRKEKINKLSESFVQMKD